MHTERLGLSRFTRGPHKVDPDLWEAIVRLRIALLVVATLYGVWAAITVGGVARAEEWREWLTWVTEFVERVAVSMGGDRGTAARGDREEWIPAWPTEFLELIADHQKVGAESARIIWDPDWREPLERLVDRARAVERFDVRPLGEVKGELFGDGVALLGAVQDSLVLVLSADEDRRSLRADSETVYGLLMAARRHGIWDFDDV
jgi:hypothetical protein